MTAKTPEKKKLLNEDEFLLLCLIEQTFWETGNLPTNEVAADKTGLPEEKVKKAWSKPEFRQAIIARGIDLNPDKSNQVLKPKQLMLANMLLNAHDARSVREKLEQLQISPQQYAAWRRQPAFAEYLRKRAEAAFQNSDDVAYRSLVRAVEDGDVNATKLFFEMRGIHNPRIQVDINIESVMVRVVEVIQRHVKDPVVLSSISDDILQLVAEAK